MTNSKDNSKANIRKGRFIYQETVNKLLPLGGCEQAIVRAVNIVIDSVKEHNVWGRLVLNSDIAEEHPKLNTQHTVFLTGVVDEHDVYHLVTDAQAIAVNGVTGSFSKADITIKPVSYKEFEVTAIYDNGNSSISKHVGFKAKKSKHH